MFLLSCKRGVACVRGKVGKELKMRRLVFLGQLANIKRVKRVVRAMWVTSSQYPIGKQK